MRAIKRKRGHYTAAGSRGYYMMHRGWLDHPIFGDEPFSVRDAFIWLIENAIYKPDGYVHVIEGRELRLRRGQLSYSIRYMAEAWGWDDSRVDRFLKKLVKNAMIETTAETGQTVITLCNYAHYQGESPHSETAIEKASRQCRGMPEANKNKDIKKNKNENITADQKLELWQKALQNELGVTTYNAWLAEVAYTDGFLIAPSAFIQNWCEQNYEQKIQRVFAKQGLPFNGFHAPQVH